MKLCNKSVIRWSVNDCIILYISIIVTSNFRLSSLQMVFFPLYQVWFLETEATDICFSAAQLRRISRRCLRMQISQKKSGVYIWRSGIYWFFCDNGLSLRLAYDCRPRLHTEVLWLAIVFTSHETPWHARKSIASALQIKQTAHPPRRQTLSQQSTCQKKPLRD